MRILITILLFPVMFFVYILASAAVAVMQLSELP